MRANVTKRLLVGTLAATLLLGSTMSVFATSSASSSSSSSKNHRHRKALFRVYRAIPEMP